MSDPNLVPPDDWHEANQRYLSAALAAVRERLEPGEASEGPEAAAARLEQARDAMPSPPALEVLGQLFGLSPFERDLLLACAGVELDSGFAAAFSPLTFSRALSALPDAHWSALAPSSPLRRWRLIEVGSGSALTASPLRVDERILHYLAGVQHLDDRLAGLIVPLAAPADLAASQQRLARRLAEVWSRTRGEAWLPVLQLTGGEGAAKRAVAAAACAALGLEVRSLAAAQVPQAPAELDGLIRLWDRESALIAGALYLDAQEDAGDPAREDALARLIDGSRSPLILARREPACPRLRPVMSFEVAKPTAGEQRQLWNGVLGEAAGDLNGHVDALVGQFQLGASAVRSAGLQALAGGAGAGDGLGERLWRAAREQARPRLDRLAQRLEPVATWDDLVLPARRLRTLRQIAVHVRRRLQVHEEWGFARLSRRGLGVSAVFAGASGTGKTMAAEVLANELALDLYRIDLASVVSKYIGETEKNLRRVFDAAEDGGAILLFDEADALFGKRSEVKDSHDRYANIEISYLLQRMESYRGLAVLTTNMKSALDKAFLRRLRFIVEFPFPDAAQRAEIWRRIFPEETPTERLDAGKLARLNVAGGNIRNIAMGAAFLAAEEASSVGMKHLLRAARSEYEKLEKPLNEAEIRGWVE